MRRADFLHVGAVNRIPALRTMSARQLIRLSQLDREFPAALHCGFAAPGAPLIVQPIWPAVGLRLWLDRNDDADLQKLFNALGLRLD